MTDAVAGAPAALETAPAAGLSPFRASWRRYSRNKLAVGSMVILLMIALACFVTQWFSLIAYVLGLLCFIAAGARFAIALARTGA